MYSLCPVLRCLTGLQRDMLKKQIIPGCIQIHKRSGNDLFLSCYVESNNKLYSVFVIIQSALTLYGAT